MVEIVKSCQKFIFGPLKHEKFLQSAVQLYKIYSFLGMVHSIFNTDQYSVLVLEIRNYFIAL